MPNEEIQAGQPRTYQIGTVSSLTGIDAHTIRAWERRYGAIKPMRSETSRRLYTDDIVERLQLLKGLVDCSEAISTIAHLSDDALRERLAQMAEHEEHSSQSTRERSEPDRPPRVALCAPTLQIQIGMNAQSMSDFDVVSSESSADSLLQALRANPCEVVLVELDSLKDDALTKIRTFLGAPGNPLVFVLHRFASRNDLARLARAGASLVHTPIRLESLKRIVLDQVIITRAKQRRAAPSAPAFAGEGQFGANGHLSTGTAPPRRFDDAKLARLLEITTAVACECPNHLSSLISGLIAFEEYSRNCESRDEEDAAQHHRLAVGTAEARARMESLLVDLCAHEGIAI
ncbi:MAG: MerR family transcriptional regulator [Myxococcota bacterium]